VAGQCDTENAGQWTLLSLHEQAQHLTLRLSRCRKRERGTSGRWRQSAAGGCSAPTGVLNLGKECLHLPPCLHFLGQQTVVDELIKGCSNTRFQTKTYHGTVPVFQLRRSAFD